MKKLVLFREWKFHQVYQSWLNKYRVKKEFVALVEIWMLVFAILFCLLVFLIYINKSSTQWFFLRQARNAYNNTVFNHEIIKTEILDLKKINRDRLKENDSRTYLWTNVETINID
jgi:lipopolysaccharide/colanic/teichoic acid biosynthesis glycosyltransferase